MGVITLKIILNAGHTAKGAGSGAVGYINESEETRKVVSLIRYYLRGKGHEVILASVDKAESQAAYLYGVARKANEHEDADLFVSVHFNAGGGNGSECYTYKGKESAAAIGICKELSALGFRNRGVKDGSHIYVISKTKMPAVLVEVCFVDSLADTKRYKQLGSKVAQAITRGILAK
jgi:N-acetylmuramoyl-L-alanine amidase